jgi:hypothetical protein
MGTEAMKVHDKDRALFERIDATLAAYDAAVGEPVPGYLAGYAAELDQLRADTTAARQRA